MEKVESKIPDAWGVMKKYPNSGSNEVGHSFDWNDIEEMMIEFAKLHVQEALKIAAKKATINCYEYNRQGEIINLRDCGQEINCGSITYYSTNKDSMLNAYSLDNIK